MITISLQSQKDALKLLNAFVEKHVLATVDCHQTGNATVKAIVEQSGAAAVAAFTAVRRQHGHNRIYFRCCCYCCWWFQIFWSPFAGQRKVESGWRGSFRSVGVVSSLVRTLNAVSVQICRRNGFFELIALFEECQKISKFWRHHFLLKMIKICKFSAIFSRIFYISVWFSLKSFDIRRNSSIFIVHHLLSQFSIGRKCPLSQFISIIVRFLLDFGQHLPLTALQSI